MPVAVSVRGRRPGLFFWDVSICTIWSGHSVLPVNIITSHWLARRRARRVEVMGLNFDKIGSYDFALSFLRDLALALERVPSSSGGLLLRCCSR